MSFAYQEEREYRQPSEERGKVANWIVWPSILLMICGLVMGAGVGLAYREFYNTSTMGSALNGRFVWGVALFGMGFLGMWGVILYSLSFDASPRTTTTKKTPVMMTPLEVKQTIAGNAEVMIPTSNSHIVEAGNRKYNFTNEQMRHMANRYFMEGTDYRITRDDPTGKKMFQDWAFAKIVMFDAKYWTEDGGAVVWTEDGGEWFESRMRLIVG